VKILVTGASGFLGINVLERLLGNGHRVTALSADALPPLARAELQRLPGELEEVRADVRDGAALERLLRDGRFDAALAAAAITAGAARQREVPAEIIEVNFAAVARLATLCAKYGIPRVVALSSSAAMGERSFGASAVVEEDSPQPATLYGITKAAIEYLIGVAPGMRVARVAAVFGAWERDTGVRDFMSPPFQLAQAAVRRRAIAALPAGGERDWVHAPYAAGALEWLLTAPQTRHSLYNLGGGRLWHPREFAEALGAVGLAPRTDGTEEIAFNDDLSRKRTFLAVDRLSQEFAAPPVPGEAAATYAAWVVAHRAWFA
jgi:nucleoside-diphosphate-sugar epimerase